MRLTLRTLLAWLDDTLSPSEVREIGKQVAESPFAKDLVEKIHRVTRQRRLTVPPSRGPDAIDPNLVASYLDNELDPDGVSELEKKCLVSDVHLAEVASVHQVLSLIGQKAKVPTEARLRMYQLIKGREAVKPKAGRASRLVETRTVSEPVQAWVSPPPSRPRYEQYVPAAVVALMGVLGATAWMSLSPSPDSSPRFSPSLVASNAPGHPAAVGRDARAVGPPEETVPVKDVTAPEAPKAADLAAATPVGASAKDQETSAQEKGAASKAEKPAGEVPPGSVGLAKKPTGVLLRFNPERRDWERLTGATALREQDRLLSLAPFRSAIELGTADVDLVGETEIWARGSLPTFAARLSLAQGRVVLHGTTPSLPFEIQFGGKAIKVTPPPGGAVGVERLNRRALGEPKAGASVLRFYAGDGPVKLETGSHDLTLDDSGAVTVEADGSFSGETTKSESWVTATEPSAFDQKVGEQFLKFFPPDRPLMTSLVEASEDEQKDVCLLAISSLRAVGDILDIVPLINSRGNPFSAGRRKATILVLKSYLAQGPDAAKELRTQLQRELGDDQAAAVEKLFVGYTPKEAGEEATYAKLVQYLGTTEPSDVGLRELALENLMELTGRDNLDYDPEKPEGKGLKAWRDLLHNHELKPLAPTKAEK
jgi:hypothetical protein